jgi:ABC-type Na+ transport system ATPase subunit NatA
MDRKIDSLSYTEKIYLNILRSTLLAKQKIIYKNIFMYLDHLDKKKVTNYIDYLKNNDYFIIVTSKNVDDLYKLGEQSVVFYDKYFKFDKTDKVYTGVQDLLDNNIDVPTLCLITYKAKTEKNIKLFYRKDVRDTIKDIYKHV